MSDMSAQDVMAAFGISLEEEPAEEYRGVMVFAEAMGGEISASSLGALGFGREIADAFGARLEVPLLGGDEAAAQALIRRGADTVIVTDAPAAYEPGAWAGAMTSAIQSRKPEVVLFGGSDIARELAPRIAQRLSTGLIAGAQRIRAEADERLVVGIVALFGGRLLGEFACPEKRPQIISFAEGVGRIPSEDASRQGEIETLAT
jgi:electron transfer flavoprotein alpha subunit